VSGLWVAPVEVEECLMRHDAVSVAAVIGFEELGLTKIKAFIVLREATKGTEALVAELQEHVKARLSKHKYPRAIENDRGKVDRRALRASVPGRPAAERDARDGKKGS
jgi:acyl-coenzyme A synthetase/AMP-(fatty) acid ligase